MNGDGGSDGRERDDASALSLPEAAQRYVELGLIVIPIKPGCKAPPLIAAWQDLRVADPAQVFEWWRCWPRANIGLLTGAASGVVVLDVDGEIGERSLAALVAKHGSLPIVCSARTPHGRHIYFRHPGRAIKNSVGKIGPGLDLRGDAGYVVVAPSIVVPV